MKSIRKGSLFLMALALMGLEAFLCFSCVEKRESQQIAYTMNLDSALQVLPEVADVEYIPLATNDTSLIGDVDKVLYRGDTFYVFDKQGQKILLFDRQGNFLKSIHKVGQGPGEYTEPYDMDVDADGNIYLSDVTTQSIIVYKQGDENDYQVFRIGEIFLDFTVVNNSIYLGLIYKEGEMKQNLAVWNREKEVVEVLKENRLMEGNRLPYTARHYMFRSADKVFYYERFQPYIYRLEEHAVDSCIFFSSKRVPAEEEVKAWAECDRMEQIRKNMQYIGDVSGCYETDSHILVEFRSLPTSYGIIDKNYGKNYYVSSKQAAAIPSKGICGVADNRLLSYFLPSPQVCEKLLKDLPEGKGAEKLSGLSDDDNPVLLLFKFKGEE